MERCLLSEVRAEGLDDRLASFRDKLPGFLRYKAARGGVRRGKGELQSWGTARAGLPGGGRASQRAQVPRYGGSVTAADWEPWVGVTRLSSQTGKQAREG